VALGNRRQPESVGALAETLAREAEPTIRAHAAWALGEIGRNAPPAAAETPGAAPTSGAGAAARSRAIRELERACDRDPDAAVRNEAREALARLR
jgi:hypothetical protein